MKCFTCCFRTNSNHNKIITKKPCNNSSNKINSISPQALQDLLDTRENGEPFVAIKEEADHHEEIVKSINLIEGSKDIISRENLLEFEEDGEAYVEAINAKNEEGRHKIVNPMNLFEESKDEEEEEEGDDDDGFEDHIDLEDVADKNDDGNEMIHDESSYESLFSLSIDDSTRKGDNPIPEIMCDKEEVSSPLKSMLLGRFKNAERLVSDPQEVVHFWKIQHECDNSLKQSIKFSANDQISQLPVLNTIRNPWLLKDTGITTPHSLLKQQEEKENIDMNLLDLSTTYNRAKDEPSLKHQENEIAVDASLESWLVECSQDDTPNSKNSVGSIRNSPSERRVGVVDRPVLGALTVEELKDENSIVIGTIGSYLRHTGQVTSISSY